MQAVKQRVTLESFDHPQALKMGQKMVQNKK